MLFLLQSEMITELLMISEVIKLALAREEALLCSEQPGVQSLFSEKIYPQFLKAYVGSILYGRTFKNLSFYYLILYLWKPGEKKKKIHGLQGEQVWKISLLINMCTKSAAKFILSAQAKYCLLHVIRTV